MQRYLWFMNRALSDGTQVIAGQYYVGVGKSWYKAAVDFAPIPFCTENRQQ